MDYIQCFHIIKKNKKIEIKKSNYKFIEMSFYVFNTELVFTTEFNEPIDDYIEIIEKYDSIHFGNSFNQKIDNLPKNIKKIRLGHRFNQSLDNLPPNLEELYLSIKFNLPVNNLPKTLKILVFELFSFFNHEIDNLPPNLKKLELGFSFNKPVDFLPISLECLTFRNVNYPHDLLNLPLSLKELKISKKYKGNVYINPDCKKIDLKN